MSAQIVADADGRVISWDAEAARLLGYTASEMVGRLVVETIVPSRYRAQCEAASAAFHSTGAADFLGQLLQVTAMRKDGTEAAIDLRIIQFTVDPPTFLGLIDVRDESDTYTGAEHRAYAADVEAVRAHRAADVRAAAETTAEGVAEEVRLAAEGVEHRRQEREESVARRVMDAASTAEDRRILAASAAAVAAERRDRKAADVAAEVKNLTVVVSGLTTTAEGVKAELVEVKRSLVELLAETRALHEGYGVDESTMKDRSRFPSLLLWWGRMMEEAVGTGKTRLALVDEMIAQRASRMHVSASGLKVFVILTPFLGIVLGAILTYLLTKK